MIIFQKGFNYSQDGPGNRLVYHLQGCNMRCLWCSNPEGMELIGGREYSPEEIVAECVRSKMMFFSGGGVTFTGGEATLQKDDLIETLRGLRQEKIHTAIETNATSPHLPSIAEYVDYLIMDFKHYDGDVLKKYTGVGCDTVKKNYEYFCSVGRQLHVRIPLINHVNADDAEVFAEYFSGFDTQRCVFEFLPYHEYGKEKWKSEYKMSDAFVSREQLAKFYETFGQYDLNTIKT